MDDLERAEKKKQKTRWSFGFVERVPASDTDSDTVSAPKPARDTHGNDSGNGGDEPSDKGKGKGKTEDKAKEKGSETRRAPRLHIIVEEYGASASTAEAEPKDADSDGGLVRWVRVPHGYRLLPKGKQAVLGRAIDALKDWIKK
ncbi:hypothetical protein VN97_g11004 [Penicillium thymicola]|uniref:Uncharacterized protein n=1 Tax=Penicillium thymicola TaxID=293382 RepID=A0AAI9T7X6_PENTH|nr:hypothetical protein VN97_g11004 [Penicillium thymicola]